MGFRAIANQVDRASVRTTVTYQFHPRLQAGIEYNPRAGDVGPLFNFLAVPESSRRPAIILGSSSDRIGTTKGRSLYVTASKDVKAWTNLPIAPYVGAAYGSFDDRTRVIGGLLTRLPGNIDALTIFDGVHVHPTLSYPFRSNHVLTLILVKGRDAGFSYSFSF